METLIRKTRNEFKKNRQHVVNAHREANTRLYDFTKRETEEIKQITLEKETAENTDRKQHILTQGIEFENASIKNNVIYQKYSENGIRNETSELETRDIDTETAKHKKY